MVRRWIILGFVGAALGATTPAAAQVALKLGASFNKISNKGVLPSSLDNRESFTGGIALGAGRVVGFGIEALYARRGLTSDQSGTTIESKLDYIDVPAYLRLTLPTPGVQPFGYLGPQVSFEIRCEQASGGDCNSATTNRPKTTYAGVIGAGVKFGRAITVEGRYVYGLTDLKLATVTNSESFKDRTFVILVGIGL